MQEFELELSVGETLQIGDNIVTVIDIDDGEFSVRVDSVDDVSALCPATEPLHLLHVLEDQG